MPFLTFDMSGDRPAKPVGHPLDGMVRRRSSSIEPKMNAKGDSRNALDLTHSTISAPHPS